MYAHTHVHTGTRTRRPTHEEIHIPDANGCLQLQLNAGLEIIQVILVFLRYVNNCEYRFILISNYVEIIALLLYTYIVVVVAVIKVYIIGCSH